MDSQPEPENGQVMAKYSNLVDWTLSGEYDAEEPILIDAEKPDRSISRRMAKGFVAGLAGSFAQHSTVCLHLPNDVLYPVLMLSIWASKCRWTGTNTAYTEHELRHHLVVSRSRYIVTLQQQVEVVQAASATLEWDVEIILFSDIIEARDWSIENPYSLRTLHDILAEQKDGDLGDHLAQISLDDIAALPSTSGTTGLPKVAARTHRAMIQETAVIADNNDAKPYKVRRLFCTPIFHAFSTPEMAINPLRLGYPTYFLRRFDDRFAQKVHDFEITETAAPPPMLMRMVQQSDSHHLLQNLRMIFSGGAPLAAELETRVRSIFKSPPRIVQVWGMTEGGWFTTFKYPETDATGSVGALVSGFEIMTSSENEITTVDGIVAGELLVRSRQIMTAYFGNDEATEAAFTGDWLRTGDIGYVEQGKVYLIDRAKDLIKVNGWQVAPAEIEDALLRLPEVLDAAAIGAGHGIDEHPLVFVVVRSADVQLSDIQAHLRERLARYKVASIEILITDAIPRNPSGKVLRKMLRDVVARREK